MLNGLDKVFMLCKPKITKALQNDMKKSTLIVEVMGIYGLGGLPQLEPCTQFN